MSGSARIDTEGSGLSSDAAASAADNKGVSLLRVAAIALILIAVPVAFFALGLDSYLSLQTLEDNRAWLLDQVAKNFVVTAAAFVAIYAVAVAISVPGAAFLTIAGGFLFGTVQGTIFTVVGATLGAVALFLFVRAGLGGTLKARAGSSTERLRRGFNDNALGYLLFLRLMPVVPFWLVNLAAAIVGVPLRTFVVATALGIIPGSAIFASFGSGLGFILDAGGEADLGAILSPQVALPLIGLALLSLAPVVYRAMKRRRTAKPS